MSQSDRVTARSYRSPRREKAAADTRAAILDAAEELFAAQGYAGTTVTQIAAAAAVAPNTVYISFGGKPQLVVALVDRGSDDPLIANSLDDVDAMTDGREIIRRLAAGTGATRRSQQRAIAVMMDNVTADPLIAEVVETATTMVRKRIQRVAARLAAAEALREGITTARAAAVLWFYFGFAAWRELRAIGWSWKETENWLTEQAITALLEHH